MKKHTPMVAALIALAASGVSAAPRTGDQVGQADTVLSATIAALDAKVFDAFNHCSDPQQLQRHGSYFAPDVEFYHDTGGVAWSRQEMLDTTGKYACGQFRRELVPGTLKVFPIKGFGAIEQGTHRFCQFADGQCDGVADFTIVWNHQNGVWTITRVLSYGHRPNE